MGSGELEITQLAPREKQGRNAGGRRNDEASFINGAEARTNQAASRGSGEIREETPAPEKQVEAKFEKYAKREKD